MVQSPSLRGTMATSNGCIRKLRNRRKGHEIDGPYAWLVVFASFFSHVMVYGIIWCSGIFYDLFSEMFEGGSGLKALIATLSTACTFGFSPVTGTLINRFGHRIVAMVGGLIAGTALVMSAYATNLYFLAGTFGVLAGIGFGVAYLPAISIVPLYFEKWRAVALGVAVSGAGFGVFIYPPLIRLLVNTYGLRGCLLIIGGFTYNICLCGALMRIPRVRAPLLVKSQSSTSKDTTNESSPNCSDDSPTWDRPSKTLDGSATPERKRTCLALLNLHIFRNVSYLVFCLNNFLCMFGMSVVFVHLSSYSKTKGLSNDTAAMLVSALGISNLIGRLLFGILAKVPCFSALGLYISALFVGGVVIILLPFMEQLVGILAFASMFGLLTACIGPLIPQLITEFLSIALIPSGYGYLLVFEAIGSLLGPPTAGYIYDQIEVYAVSFYVGGAVLAASGAIMIVPYLLQKLRSRQTQDRLPSASDTSSSEIKVDLSNA